MTSSTYGSAWWAPTGGPPSWTAVHGFVPEPQQFLQPVDAGGHRVAPGYFAEGHPPAEDSGHVAKPAAEEGFLFEHELTQLLSEAAQDHDRQRFTRVAATATGRAAPSAPSAPSRHRRQHAVRSLMHRLGWSSLTSLLLVLVSAVLTLAVSAISGVVSYRPLQQLASPTAGGLSACWPVLVYGPWVVGVLSLLRIPTSRRLYRRAAWSAVVAFSGIAALLCLAHTPHTIIGVATQALPPAAAVTCVALLAPQLSRTRPRHALLRQRV